MDNKSFRWSLTAAILPTVVGVLGIVLFYTLGCGSQSHGTAAIDQRIKTLQDDVSAFQEQVKNLMGNVDERLQTAEGKRKTCCNEMAQSLKTFDEKFDNAVGGFVGSENGNKNLEKHNMSEGWIILVTVAINTSVIVLVAAGLWFKLRHVRKDGQTNATTTVKNESKENCLDNKCTT